MSEPYCEMKRWMEQGKDWTWVSCCELSSSSSLSWKPENQTQSWTSLVTLPSSFEMVFARLPPQSFPDPPFRKLPEVRHLLGVGSTLLGLRQC